VQQVRGIGRDATRPVPRALLGLLLDGGSDELLDLTRTLELNVVEIEHRDFRGLGWEGLDCALLLDDAVVRDAAVQVLV
jgi:hypothetical protein